MAGGRSAVRSSSIKDRDGGGWDKPIQMQVWLNRPVLAFRRWRQEDQDVRVVLSFIVTESSVRYVRSCLQEERHVLKAERLGSAVNMVHEGGTDQRKSTEPGTVCTLHSSALSGRLFSGWHRLPDRRSSFLRLAPGGIGRGQAKFSC